MVWWNYIKTITVYWGINTYKTLKEESQNVYCSLCFKAYDNMIAAFKSLSVEKEGRENYIFEGSWQKIVIREVDRCIIRAHIASAFL